MKRAILIGIVAILLVSTVVKAVEIVNVPGNVTEFKREVENINKPTGLFSFVFSITGQSGTWRVCYSECVLGQFPVECNPCKGNEVKSNCFYAYDYSSLPCIGMQCCKPEYNYVFNIQCYCKPATSECPGGYKPGERKCEGNRVYECKEGGSWQYVKTCDYKCENGRCVANPCQPHAYKKCYNGNVWWYDSCGNREEIAEYCDYDEECVGSRCERVCEEGFIGERYCLGSNVMQEYQYRNCYTEPRLIEVCDYKCENGVCISPECPECPEPSEWSECIDGKMERIVYYCDETTNYECVAKTETQACDCNVDDDCKDDEYCENYICKKLECKEGEIATNHQCVAVTSELTVVYLILLVIVILAFVYFAVRKIMQLKG